MIENVHTILAPCKTFERIAKDIYFEFETDYGKYNEYGINDILRIIETDNNGVIDPKKASIMQGEFTYLLRTPKNTIVGIKILRSKK